jgi:hypothetical protein
MSMGPTGLLPGNTRSHSSALLLAIFWMRAAASSTPLGLPCTRAGTQYNSLPVEKNRHLKSSEIPAAWDTGEVAATCPAGTALLLLYKLQDG